MSRPECFPLRNTSTSKRQIAHREKLPLRLWLGLNELISFWLRLSGHCADLSPIVNLSLIGRASKIVLPQLRLAGCRNDARCPPGPPQPGVYKCDISQRLFE
jgi:hypothetical protein